MNRLIQGDVGSGKTVVAASAILQASKNDSQVIIMAPTQVLAQQHHQTLSEFLTDFKIKPVLVTADTKKKNSNADLINSPLLVGTHALLYNQDVLNNPKLKLVVIDEQHRFGVLQRSHFLERDTIPHLLTLSATPIPRSIALSLHGHLNISDIKTMPKDRKPIKTWVVPESKRKASYTWIQDQIQLGSQVFVVCPFIDRSESDTLKNVRAVTVEYENLKKVFPKLKLGLLHGRLKAREKDDILTSFKRKKFDILVTTQVIEVGIDVPNATIMVIEDSSRFGLSQLHQLRGRVGRADKQSFCLLFVGAANDSISRLQLMEQHNDGLTLAQLDLKLRGAGELFGTAQTGHLDTQFDYFWDKPLNLLAKQTADSIIRSDFNYAKKLLSEINPDLAKNASPN